MKKLAVTLVEGGIDTTPLFVRHSRRHESTRRCCSVLQ